MLCRRLNKILYTRSSINHSSQYRGTVTNRSKCSWINSVLSALKTDPMSSLRLRIILRDLRVTRLWNAWIRTQLVSFVVKRCRRDRGVRDMLACFRQTILRPSRTFLLSATAAYQSNSGDDGGPTPCRQDITDEDLEALIQDLDGVDELSRATLFCAGCAHRLVIDKKYPGVLYCTCKDTQPPGASEDGWIPYMEAEDVVIWRKEYKPGGLFAYKVYGRYRDLHASDFATIQVDGAYRRQWDDAVADLSVVERPANGVASQAVLHWEVAWPRLFSNRDYVYIRRHKLFAVKTKCQPHKEAIFRPDDPEPCRTDERPSVHSHAKRKSEENERREARHTREEKVNNVYVIISRSCTHPEVPERRHAIRVQEYWSNMVVRTIDGPDNLGMEFVLTYYDEPSVGGLPSGVSAWATGRAAPAFLARMHRAAAAYTAWLTHHTEEPDFEPFGTGAEPTPAPAPAGGQRGAAPDETPKPAPEVVTTKLASEVVTPKLTPEVVTPKSAPEAVTPKPDSEAVTTIASKDKSTQTESDKVEVKVSKLQTPEVVIDVTKSVLSEVRAQEEVKSDSKDTSDPKAQTITPEVKVDAKVKVAEPEVVEDTKVKVDKDGDGTTKVIVKESEDKVVITEESSKSDECSDEAKADESEGDAARNGSWWRYLYPFYYFV